MIEKRKSFIINIVYFGIMLCIGLALVRFSLSYLMPFIFGFTIAFILKPVVNRLTSRFGEKKLVRILVVALFYFVIASIIVMLVVWSIGFFSSAFESLESLYNKTLLPFTLDTIDYANSQIDLLSPEIRSVLEEVLNSFVSMAKNFAANASSAGIGFVTGFVGAVPSLLISILIGIISSIFFTLDYQPIVNSVLGVLPKRWAYLIIEVKNTFFNTIGKYLIAYGKLITLTFVELSIGFFVIGIGNPIGLAFLIAIVDIMPVLGTGTIMIPWFIAELAMGNTTVGISLAVLYIIITIIRNILEPKLVGAQIGLHPLATLICIYVGLKLWGVVGMFGIPIAVVIIKTMHEQGKITFLKEIMEDSDAS